MSKIYFLFFFILLFLNSIKAQKINDPLMKCHEKIRSYQAYLNTAQSSSRYRNSLYKKINLSNNTVEKQKYNQILNINFVTKSLDQINDQNLKQIAMLDLYYLFKAINAFEMLEKAKTDLDLITLDELLTILTDTGLEGRDILSNAQGNYIEESNLKSRIKDSIKFLNHLNLKLFISNLYIALHKIIDDLKQRIQTDLNMAAIDFQMQSNPDICPEMAKDLPAYYQTNVSLNDKLANYKIQANFYRFNPNRFLQQGAFLRDFAREVRSLHPSSRLDLRWPKNLQVNYQKENLTQREIQSSVLKMLEKLKKSVSEDMNILTHTSLTAQHIKIENQMAQTIAECIDQFAHMNPKQIQARVTQKILIPSIEFSHRFKFNGQSYFELGMLDNSAKHQETLLGYRYCHVIHQDQLYDLIKDQLTN